MCYLNNSIVPLYLHKYRVSKAYGGPSAEPFTNDGFNLRLEQSRRQLAAAAAQLPSTLKYYLSMAAYKSDV